MCPCRSVLAAWWVGVCRSPPGGGGLEQQPSTLSVTAIPHQTAPHVATPFAPQTRRPPHACSMRILICVLLSLLILCESASKPQGGKKVPMQGVACIFIPLGMFAKSFNFFAHFHY